MMSNGRDAAKVAAFVAGGAVVGAALGLLYAPQSGPETRRQIRLYAKKAQVHAIRYGRTIKDNVDHALESGKSWLAKKEGRRPIAA